MCHNLQTFLKTLSNCFGIASKIFLNKIPKKQNNLPRTFVIVDEPYSDKTNQLLSVGAPQTTPKYYLIQI